MTHGHGPSPEIRHETREASVKVMVYSTIGLAISTTFIFLIVWGLFNYFKYDREHARTISPMAQPYALPPEPRLQVNPTIELQNLRTREDHILSTYSWVDQKSGSVRIPIDKAMDIIAERGLPYRNSTGGAGGTQTAAAPAAKANATKAAAPKPASETPNAR